MADANDPRSISELFDDDELIEAALREGTRAALREHKLAGNPIAVWRDGQVVWIPADEIDVEMNGDRSID